MPRKNPRGVSYNGKPDNQQERPEDIGWVVGFTDGEGCFSVSIIKNKTTKTGWQVFPEFVVTQGSSSRSSLESLKDFFECGRIFENKRYDNHREHLLRFCVRSRAELKERIIPFFQMHRLRTKKGRDFNMFCQIIDLMDQGEHLKISGMKKIAKIIEKMNRRVPSRLLESSETTRQTST